jgi:hypothetical protein
MRRVQPAVRHPTGRDAENRERLGKLAIGNLARGEHVAVDPPKQQVVLAPGAVPEQRLPAGCPSTKTVRPSLTRTTTGFNSRPLLWTSATSASKSALVMMFRLYAEPTRISMGTSA